jgi:nucleotide-binding universal stress UspA family protein
MTVEATAKLPAAGLLVPSAVREGDPKHILIGEAEAWKADGIFVGARGLSRLERFWLGSHKNSSAKNARCAD